MEEVFVADGADFAITEKARQANWSQALLDHLGIVIGPGKEVFAAPVTATEASAVDGAPGKPLLRGA